jgi:hypothetical protein
MKFLLEVENNKASFIIELLSNFDFVKFNKLTKEQKAEIGHIKKAIDQIDSINKGLIKTKSAEVFLDEL